MVRGMSTHAATGALRQLVATRSQVKGARKYVTWTALALMTTGSIASLRSAPTMAVFGLASGNLLLRRVEPIGAADQAHAPRGAAWIRGWPA